MNKYVILIIFVFSLVVGILVTWECIKFKIKSDRPYLGKNPKIIFYGINFDDLKNPEICFGGIIDEKNNSYFRGGRPLEFNEIYGDFEIIKWKIK